MPTTKKRINISVSKDMDEALERLAKRDQEPVATKAVRLIEEALEMEEDEMLNAIALSRDTPDATFLSHEDTWGPISK